MMSESIRIPDASRPGHVLIWEEREGYYASVLDPDLYPNDDELVDLALEHWQ